MTVSREVRRMGDRALLVRCAPDDVAPLLREVDAAVADGRLSGVEDVVPAARTLLVRLAPGQDATRVATLVAGLAVRRTATVTSRTVSIEVDYDGADLDAVARETGMTVADVVAVHTAATYTVAFCGFAPGFPYLTGLDPRLHLPRLPTPRTRVPAGSVAIAAEYAGIYPRPSPGGWRLLGRTDAALFDPHRSPPGLLGPGDRVRFVRRTR